MRCDYGRYHVVQGLEISGFARGQMQVTEQELLEERNTVAELLPEGTAASHNNLSVCLRSGITLYEDGISLQEQYLQTDTSAGCGPAR